MKIRVIYSQWGADGFDAPLGGGDHDLETVTEEQARSIAGAAAAGVVEVLDATAAEQTLLEPHVQSQEDGEAAFAAAQGEWVEAVYEDVVDKETGLVVGVGSKLVEPGYWTGGWTHGNLISFIAAQKDRLLHDDALRAGRATLPQEPVEVHLRAGDATLAQKTVQVHPLSDEERAEIERQIGLAEGTLKKIGVPK